MATDTPYKKPYGMPSEYRAVGNDGRIALRARRIAPMGGEGAARGMAALAAPLAVVDDGVILAANGVILAVEPYRHFRRRSGVCARTPVHDLGDVLLTPGFVNCHTHLELSHLRGRTVRGKGFAAWVKSLVALDTGGGAGAASVAPPTAAPTAGPTASQGADTHMAPNCRDTQTPADTALEDAVTCMAANATAAVVDISSRMPDSVLAALRRHGMLPRVLLEAFGHDPAKAEALARRAEADAAYSMAGHALYSTSVPILASMKKWSHTMKRPMSFHLAEHEDEVECLVSGSGSLHDQLRVRVLPSTWRAPRKRPVLLAREAGLLRPGTVAVHCVCCSGREVQDIAHSGAAVCLCPRSNAYIAVGEAPARAFADSGALLVLGTDSLASNDDANVWNEAEYFLRTHMFPPNALLRMLTVNGATAAMLSGYNGTLAAGQPLWYSVFPSELAALFVFA